MMAVQKKYSLESGIYKLYSNGGDTSKRWFFNYYLVSENGFRKRTRIYGYINKHSNPDKRFRAAELLLAELSNGTYEAETFEPVHLQAVFSDYFETRCRTLRPKTKTTSLTKVNLFLAYCAKKKVDSLLKVNKKFAIGFLASIKRSSTTVNTYRDTMRTFFEDFVSDKMIPENPFARVAKLPEERRGKFPFSENQVMQLKNRISSEHPVLWMGCMLEYYCFIRPGESRLLRVEDVNLDEDYILLHASISKNKKTQPVSLPSSFKEALTLWLKDLPQNYFVLNRALAPVSRDYLNKQHHKFLQSLGFSSRFSFYSWKHTGAFSAIKAGISLKDLQMQMRHHSLDQLNEYLREMGIMDSVNLKNNFPAI